MIIIYSLSKIYRSGTRMSGIKKGVMLCPIIIYFFPLALKEHTGILVT